MYLVEVKLGAFKIRKYIMTSEDLAKFIEDNPQYEYIKIIEEIDDKTKVRRRIKDER